MRVDGLVPAERQYAFHPGRRWKFDFAWPAQMVAVEVEGGIWRQGGGAHSHPSNIERDIEKGNAATELGWSVYRVTTDMVKAGDAIELLKRVLRAKKKGAEAPLG